MTQFREIVPGSVWQWQPTHIKPSYPTVSHVAIFDLDGTLIETNRRPKDANDFELCQGVIEALNALMAAGVSIIIVSNQGGLSYGNVKIIPRLNAVMQKLTSQLSSGIIMAYLAGAYDRFRKPMTGIFEEYILPMFPGARKWRYIGDAAGRAGDFSSTDRKYAYNIDLIFQYMHQGRPSTPPLQKLYERFPSTFWRSADGTRPQLVFQVPEEIFGSGDRRPREWWGLYPAGLLKNMTPNERNARRAYYKTVLNTLAVAAKKNPILVIMIGQPGSGKSRFADQLSSLCSARHLNSDNYPNPRRYTDAIVSAAREYRSCISDATHPSQASRMMHVSPVIAINSSYRVYYVHMNVPEELALHLNRMRGYYGRAIVPEVAYRKYWKDFQNPAEMATTEEGRLFELQWFPDFAKSDERFRFLQFTEEGATHRTSTQED